MTSTRPTSMPATGSSAGCPRWAEPYARLARLDRPIGTWLLLFPGWWGIALAGAGLADPVLLALFAIGAVVMRGAGCTLNDIADREYDGQVARTRLRPLPSGRVTVPPGDRVHARRSSRSAPRCCSASTAPASCSASPCSALIGTYPFMKRITYWPQLFLGLNFNWGALIGWTAVTGALAWPPLLLYLGGIFWTLGYDTIYAHQDKEDDARIGVKSSALALGDRTRPFLFVLLRRRGRCCGRAAGAAAGLGLAVLGRAGRRRGCSSCWQARARRHRRPRRLPRANSARTGSSAGCCSPAIVAGHFV